MQIVIDIPEERFKDIQRIASVQIDSNHFKTAEQIIAKGTPLPKGHGYDVLDKIRAEIEKTTSRYTISRERGAMGQVEWFDRLIKESEVLEIIDKYKAESEER